MRPGLAPFLAAFLALLLAGCTSFALPSEPGRETAPPPTPTREPAPSGDPSSSPAARTPDVSPTSTPEETPDPAAMGLDVTSCNGGVVLQWTPSIHPDFNHYLALRSPEREIAPQYPPIAPAVDWGDVYATDRFVTSAYDASIIPSGTIWYYRVVAYDARGRVVSASSVEAGRLHPRHDLGEVEATSLEDGRTRLAWGSFDGLPGCFSSYRLLYGTGGLANTVLTTISDRRRTSIETNALHPGTAYTLRVQAVRTTTLGHFVVGETEPVAYAVSDP